MALVNATPFAAQDATFLDEHGDDVAAVIVKAAFFVDESGVPTVSDEPASVRVADELAAPDETWSSALYPSDLTWKKVGADVVVVGDAVAIKPVRVMDVMLTVGSLSMPLRVHGERLFCKGSTGMTVGAAAPFERMPIVWERAYGGVSADQTAMENRNPAGRGVAKRPADLDGLPAPQIEHPARPIAGPNDKNPPVGYGPILCSWSPRRERMGTLDAAWQAQRMPLLPLDFDLRFNNVAAPSLQLAEGLTAGQRVAIAGMSLAPLVFDLPRLPVVIRARFEVSGKRVVTPAIDTLLIEPNKRRVELTARACFPVGRGRDVLRELTVDLADD